jgi:hypothetical protein
MTAEYRRLEENRHGTSDWLAWGPYLSECQWGTVREDYSPGFERDGVSLQRDGLYVCMQPWES